MNTSKLKLEEIQVESFETAAKAEAMEAHIMVTLRGQTYLCTQCGNQQCGA
jgi:hypothetical protein